MIRKSLITCAAVLAMTAALEACEREQSTALQPDTMAASRADTALAQADERTAQRLVSADAGGSAAQRDVDSWGAVENEKVAAAQAQGTHQQALARCEGLNERARQSCQGQADADYAAARVLQRRAGAEPQP
jgi:hypothetical protein